MVISYHIIDKSCHRRKAEVVYVRNFFQANGWLEGSAAEEADCVILFTCAEMRYKVANMIREVEELSRRISPGAEFIVGSCLPKTDKEALARVFQGPTITPTDFGALNTLPGISIRIEEIPPAYGRDAAFQPLTGPSQESLGGAMHYRLARWTAAFVRHFLPFDALIPFAARLARTRPMSIHVSAGCIMQCSYCAIQAATGHIRSKPADVIVNTISDGLRRGYRTFDFLSDSIGCYGMDLGTDLGELIDRVLALPGCFTIGISDLHPTQFITFFDNIHTLCRAGRLHYLYVPVQSGNERILRAMNRPCDMRNVTAKLRVLRKYGLVFLQTGIIVGFPGETEEEFEDTIRFLQEVGFDNVYVHYYCDMPNTIASALPHKTEKKVMVERLAKLGRSGVRFNAAKTRVEWESTLMLS